MTKPDDALKAIAQLSEHDVAPLRAAQIQRRAREAFDEAHANAHPPSAIERIYHRTMEPLMVAAVALVYLAWAFDAAIALYN